MHGRDCFSASSNEGVEFVRQCSDVCGSVADAVKAVVCVIELCADAVESVVQVHRVSPVLERLFGPWRVAEGSAGR